RLAGSGTAVIEKLSNMAVAAATEAGPIGPPYEAAFVKLVVYTFVGSSPAVTLMLNKPEGLLRISTWCSTPRVGTNPISILVPSPAPSTRKAPGGPLYPGWKLMVLAPSLSAVAPAPGGPS